MADTSIDPLISECLLSGEFKLCPGCGVITSKIDGCNYLECTYCKAGWCFLCGQKKYKVCNDKSHNSH